jgi:hypothetical protein
LNRLIAFAHRWNMTARSLLRSQITDAWHQSIRQDYEGSRINSERSLQASLWSHLKDELSPTTRRMFIEPRMTVGRTNQQVRYPDIVICNTRQVIGIIELKYLPRAQPSWRKDLLTFQWIEDNRTTITVSNARYRGLAENRRVYPLAKDVLYVWAGVHAASSVCLDNLVRADLAPTFLPLHAETDCFGKPRIR